MTKLADQFAIPFPKKLWGNRFGVHDVINGRDVYGAQGHRGTDFVVPSGTLVPSPANAEIVHVMHSEALGNVMVLRHYIAGEDNDVFTGLAHLSAPLAREGQTVSLGQHVARSGATGTSCYGAHLHLTMSSDDMGVIEGTVFDPLAFMLNFTTKKATTFQVKYTLAGAGEGLIRIAARSHISFPQIRKLNPKITGPDFLIHAGQRIRIA